MTEIQVNPTTCTCGESHPGVVIVFQGTIEHHCSSPAPCWMDEPLTGIDSLP